MRSIAIALSLLVFCALGAQAFPQNPAKRKIPCKTPENAASCYWTHGRVEVGNGDPAYRLWKIGTHHLLGIYSGQSAWHGDQDAIDNEDPEFPRNVARAWVDRIGSPLYGDFEVCPLERERAGSMQAACIESAKNMFIDHAK